MAIDEAILNKSSLSGSAQQQLAKRELRRSKNEVEAEQPQMSLRQRVAAARKAMDVKEKAKKKLEEKVATPVRMGTNYALRWAWLTLIPSLGLSLIYINLHVFLKMVFGEKLFCKLGDEWVPKKIQAAGGETGKLGGRAIGIVEVIALLILDLAVFFIVLGTLVLLSIIVSVITEPLKTIYELG